MSDQFDLPSSLQKQSVVGSATSSGPGEDLLKLEKTLREHTLDSIGLSVEWKEAIANAPRKQRAASLEERKLEELGIYARKHPHVANALGLIEEAIDKYGFDRICLAFNGGKDCTVLVHLFYFALVKTRPNCAPLPCLHIAENRAEIFPEVVQFIDESKARYGLDIIERNCGESWIFQVEGCVKSALFTLKASHPSMVAILMGTRRTDPHGSDLEDFSATDTDKGWPEFVRVNPVLDWTYHQIWDFLRELSVPYCPIYDRGYTSLGGMSDTFPNPKLKIQREGGVPSYRPAYELEDGALSERCGRELRKEN